MSTQVATIEYPDSDGKPMAENTLQYEWIVMIQGNLDDMFADDPDVFVAGDNLIYPKQGDPKVAKAPDVYVAFGRPKGYRGSYKVWEEDDIFPQVIFEVLSPSNTASDMKVRRDFYRNYGAEEYYVLDPYANFVEGWVRQGRRFDEILAMNGFVSPRLGIRFELTPGEAVLFRPNGNRFHGFVEISQRERRERHRADQEQARADQEQARADQEQARANDAVARANQLAAKLRSLGIDPETV